MYQSSIYINTVYVENSDAAGCFVWTTSTNVGGVIYYKYEFGEQKCTVTILHTRSTVETM